MRRFLFEEGKKIQIDDYTDELAEVGKMVRAVDDEHPLRSRVQCYIRAVIISKSPLTLISEDATMRWNHFPKEHLVITDEEVSDDLLRLVNTRFRNDHSGEVRYDTDDIVLDIYEQDDHLTEYNTDELTRKLIRRMTCDNGVYVPLPDYVIMINGNRLSKIYRQYGSIVMEFCEAGVYPLRHLPDANFKYPVSIYSLAVEMIKAKQTVNQAATE